LETDRGAVLTVRACREGVIDFSQAQLRDVRWWRRANLLVGSMARDDDLEIVRALLRFHLALLGNTQLTEDSWKSSKKHALDLINEIVGLVQPWGARSSERRMTDEMANLRELYKREIGDLDDPAFMRDVIGAEVERLERLSMEEAGPETAEERMERLGREKILQPGRR
jgi:hypothetical protein